MPGAAQQFFASMASGIVMATHRETGFKPTARLDRQGRIMRVRELATRVLGDAQKASTWLMTANRGLGGEIPMQLLDSDIGAQRVEQELRAIEYGMPF